MKRYQLQELIRKITQEILKEYMPPNIPTTGGIDANVTDADAQTDNSDESGMTYAEKAKREREREKKEKDAVRMGDLEVKNLKKQKDFFSQSVKKNKLDLLSKEKELQQLRNKI